MICNAARCLRFACLATWLAIAATATAAEPQTGVTVGLRPAPAVTSNSAAFKLTFAHRDLIWHGDPASPTACVYVKPGARPIATDFFLRTSSFSNDEAPTRRWMHEARIANDQGRRTVLAFTSQREKPIGTIDEQGQFVANDFFRKNRALLPSWPEDPQTLRYDPEQNALYYETTPPGPVSTESLGFLPFDVWDEEGRPLYGTYAIEFTPAGTGNDDSQASVALKLHATDATHELFRAEVGRGNMNLHRRANDQLGSYDNAASTYLTEAAYRPGAPQPSGDEPSVTFELHGREIAQLVANGRTPRLGTGHPPRFNYRSPSPPTLPPPQITIDGRFDDWRNVPGVDDPRGDIVPYLEYVPDVDLLEFKAAHDEEHIYLYARVAGRVGHCSPDGGRSYFYAYMDVDRNPDTGFVPSRDDDCYWGVDIGDDCEVQFEFVNNAFRKTFYGFCGLGGDAHVLRQQVTLGRSQYGRLDDRGQEREHYKSEYIYRGGVAEITEDLKLGTSDTIRLAISPDGSEVEVSSELRGFLKDPQGRPTVALGQTIDLAVGMECDSKAYPGKTRWAADSTPPIRGYKLLTPAAR